MTSDQPEDFFNVATKNVEYPLVDPLNGPLLLEKVEAGKIGEGERPGTPVGGVGRVGTPGVGSPAGTKEGGLGMGVQALNLEARMKAGSERLMRGFRKAEGGGSAG